MNNQCKSVYKRLIFIFSWLLLASCSETKGTDLFTLLPKSRKELIQEGYNIWKIKSIDRIETFDNVLCKAFNDTIVKYIFQGDALESIEVGFKISKTDSVAFLKKFEERGFLKAKPLSEGAKAAFIEPSQKIHYDVYIGKSYASFVHYFKKPVYPPVPNVSISQPNKEQ